MHPNGVSRDVQDKLLKERKRHRAAGTSVYPLKPSSSHLAFDSWNQMFLTGLCRNITMHQFDTPPSKVLDLGCGNGLWVLEAAKQWKNTQFVGFDLFRVQPNLHRLGVIDTLNSSYEGFSDRIHWVHGDILEKLPFESEYFDFVRICNISLGIPEDEWLDVFQEIRRVLRPGGVLEILEEDMIFPRGKVKAETEFEDNMLSVPLTTSTSSIRSLGTTSTISSTSPSTVHPPPIPPPTPSPRKSEAPTLLLKPMRSRESKSNSSRGSGMRVQGSNGYKSSDAQSLDFAELLDPRDHRKLEEAWCNMLQSRFLSSRPLSVIPLYLSAEFRDVQTHPTLHVPLPPNSDVSISSYTHDTRSLMDDDLDFELDLRAHSIRRHSAESRSHSNVQDDASLHTIRSDSTTMHSMAHMHLARTVAIIEGCREAIREEYCKLGRSFPDKKYELWQEFDAAWHYWQCDMTDRIAMRTKIDRSLSWTVPVYNNELPDWRVWRSRVGSLDSDLYTLVAEANNADMDLCRSLRGFVAFKPTDDTDRESGKRR
ncbi:hypothetical protein K474DRAFT_1706959 [Panus rudis PR-1116 ss-1]|nr:hypothetical protein K474DRAFT_1706959 [Panus rudis PR-1116 ss-1]